jgi:hypothetical protein
VIRAHGDPTDWPLDVRLHADGIRAVDPRQVWLLVAGGATLLLFSEWPACTCS